CSGPASGVRRGHAGSDLYRTNPGSSPDISTTAPTQSNPPETIENLVLTRLATAPARSCPAGGPIPQLSSSTPASRPRSSSGMVWFHAAGEQQPEPAGGPQRRQVRAQSGRAPTLL